MTFRRQRGRMIRTRRPLIRRRSWPAGPHDPLGPCVVLWSSHAENRAIFAAARSRSSHMVSCSPTGNAPATTMSGLSTSAQTSLEHSRHTSPARRKLPIRLCAYYEFRDYLVQMYNRFLHIARHAFAGSVADAVLSAPGR